MLRIRLISWSVPLSMKNISGCWYLPTNVSNALLTTDLRGKSGYPSNVHMRKLNISDFSVFSWIYSEKMMGGMTHCLLFYLEEAFYPASGFTFSMWKSLL